MNTLISSRTSLDKNLERMMRAAARWLALSALGLVSIAGARAAVDLSVSSIEVVQSIQDTGNSIRLVAQRSTAVRATLAVAGSGAPVPLVTGRLKVFVGGVEITPAGGVLPINAPFTAPLAPNRANENDTLNFELAAPTGIGASTDVDVRVEVSPVAGEVNVANNFMQLDNLTFISRTTPLIFFTRIDYSPSGLPLTPLAQVQPGVGDAMVRGLYPVNDGDPTLYRPGPFPSLPFSEDADGNGRLDVFAAEGDNLIALLAACRQFIVNGGAGPSSRVFLYGWLPGAVDGNGLSTIPGNNAFGNSEPTRYQRTFAHELTHLFGFCHPGDCPPNLGNTIDEIGWDVTARLPGNPGGNNVVGRLKPTTRFEVMVPAKVTAEAWGSIPNYNVLLNHGTLADAADDYQTNVLILRGIFNREGTQLRQLFPALRFPWPVVVPRIQDNFPLQFAARVIDDAGQIQVRPFSALFGEDGNGDGKTRFGFFEVAVPLPFGREVNSARITDLAGQVEFGRLDRSAAKPQINILSPAPNSQLGPQTTVIWKATDADTPQANLEYQVTYSADDGQTWVPIAVNVSGNLDRITFDSTQIQRSQAQGRIRVFVNDGLNSAFDEVTGLTPRDATFPPPSSPSLVVTVGAGLSSIANNYNNPEGNTLQRLFPNALPETVIYKWNAAAGVYDIYERDPFDNTWPAGVTLNPGEGAFVFTPRPQTFFFTGDIPQPGPRSRLPAGIYLVSCRAPQACLFEDLMGFSPLPGDVVQLYEKTNPNVGQNPPSSTHTFGANGWDVVPELSKGKSAFVRLVGEQPVIVDFNPKTGGPGTIITIVGRGFHDGRPDDHCIVLNLNHRYVDIECLEATGEKLVGRLGAGPASANGQDHQLMVGLGNGIRSQIIPGFRDVVLAPQPLPWTWSGIPENAAVAQATFRAVFNETPGSFHSGAPDGGALRVVLDRDWQAGQRFCISARIHKQGTGADTRIGPVTFTLAGTRFDCASRICDLIRQAFANAVPALPPITCSVSFSAGNAAITVRFADGSAIDSGNIDINLKATPVITKVSPLSGGPGTIITIEGSGFHDGLPDDHCLVLSLNHRFVDIECLTATSNRLTGRLGQGAPEASGLEHELMVGVGDGSRRVLEGNFGGIVLAPQPLTWNWVGDKDGMAAAAQPFVPMFADAAGNFCADPPMGGVMSVVLDQDWQATDQYCITARVHSQGTGADTRISPATFTRSGSNFDCAADICNLLQMAFLAHPTRPLNILCNVTFDMLGNAVITISLPGGAQIDDGDLCITRCAGSDAPRNFSASNNLTPPNAAYVSPRNDPPIVYQNGIQTLNYIHDRLILHLPPPILGLTDIYTSPGRVQFEVIADGVRFPVLAEATTKVSIKHVSDVGATQIFETEMLQLDIFGGNLPQGVRLRVSPTQPSRGQATIERVAGGYMISSSFEIFTEISRNNGESWSPALRSQTVQLETRAPEIFSVAENLTPANGAYVSPALSPEIHYPSNIITRLYVHDRLALHPPIIPIGQEIIYESPGRVQFQVSIDGGRSFNDVIAQANTTVRMTRAPDLGPVKYFDTEMLKLDIFGGNLPDRLRLQVSQKQRSLGQATIQQVPGGFQLSSFFNIFTEISFNGGQTWLPALEPQRVALSSRGPEIVSAEPEFTPPNGAYVSAPNARAIIYPNPINIITRNYIHDRMIRHGINLPPLNQSLVYQSPGRVQFEVSLNVGRSFLNVNASANTTVRMTHSQDVGPIQFFETEMTQLDIFGGNIPQGVRIRLSPKHKSGGQATAQKTDNGSYLLSSFFDLFTELSVNNGETWIPATASQRVSLESRAPAIVSTGEDLTPPGSAYISLISAPAIPYPNNIFTRNYIHFGLVSHGPPPLLNQSILYRSPGKVNFEVSINGERDYFAVSADANTEVRLTHTSDLGPIRFFDTEMLKLDIFGGNLPPGVQLRVSPTIPSRGDASIEALPAGGFILSSFFDIFTEISRDGGQSWAPALASQRVVLSPLVSPCDPGVSLQITRAGESVELSWPTAAAGFILQSATTVGDPAAWANDPGTVIVKGDRNTVTVPLDRSKTRFFRLICP